MVRAGAERLPFATGSFDLVTFGYLLRYVDDLPAAIDRARQDAPSRGRMGMVEFGRPTGIWSGPWWLYTRVGLRTAGAVIGDGWGEVGSFLGPSIDRFATEWPPERLAASGAGPGSTTSGSPAPHSAAGC